jgi:hypothetical protein
MVEAYNTLIQSKRRTLVDTMLAAETIAKLAEALSQVDLQALSKK